MRTSASRLLLASLAIATSSLMGVVTPASAASGWTSVSAGESHTCGIRAGRVYCWGNDTLGQLGDGTAGGVRATPGLIKSNASDWTSVSAGVNHTCAVRAGRVACWGTDSHGQLGDGTAGDFRPTPALVKSNATDWTSVSAGSDFTCGVRGGRVACWGKDTLGQLGDGTPGVNPDPTPGLIASGATDWTSVSADRFHTCAVRAGRVACWGDDGNGQLGDGTSLDAPDPTPGFIQSGATDWKSVSAGGVHTCAIRATVAACWGSDNSGELGDGTPGATPDPTPGLVS
jgi:alpha-tubulin suppressor-like RCC1 family protein